MYSVARSRTSLMSDTSLSVPFPDQVRSEVLILSPSLTVSVMYAGPLIWSINRSRRRPDGTKQYTNQESRKSEKN